MPPHRGSKKICKNNPDKYKKKQLTCQSAKFKLEYHFGGKALSGERFLSRLEALSLLKLHALNKNFAGQYRRPAASVPSA
jgi:hypothetical protein